jgi:hypothetical protein
VGVVGILKQTFFTNWLAPRVYHNEWTKKMVGNRLGGGPVVRI